MNKLARNAAEDASYRWRDDGVVLFSITLKQTFDDDMKEYFTFIAEGDVAARKKVDPKLARLNTPPKFGGFFAWLNTPALVGHALWRRFRLPAIEKERQTASREVVAERLRKKDSETCWAIDEIASRVVAGQRLVLSLDKFEAALLDRIHVRVSEHIKVETGHIHAFNFSPGKFGRILPAWLHRSMLGPAFEFAARFFGPPRTSATYKNIFIRFLPEQVHFSRDEMITALTEAKAAATKANDKIAGVSIDAALDALDKNANFSFLDSLDYDAIVARLGKPGQHRPGLFKLRHAFAVMHDKCFEALPWLKTVHLFGGRILWIGWPINFFISVIAISFIGGFLFQLVWPSVAPLATAWATSTDIANPSLWDWVMHRLQRIGAFFLNWLNPAYGNQLLVVWAAIVAIWYAHLEFAKRRQMTLDALHRTAGALEFGAVLSRVVATTATNAGVGRTHDTTFEPDVGHSTSIVYRRLEMEREKRDRNRETFAVIMAVIGATFAIAAAFGGFSNLFGVGLQLNPAEVNQPVGGEPGGSRNGATGAPN